MTEAKTAAATADTRALGYARRHMRLGWWALLVYLSLGLGLDALHAFKVGFYLDVSNETRRMLWTLAHAHGVLLSLVQIAFALSIRVLPEQFAPRCRYASPCLATALVLMPGGFLLGGAVVHGGDPGLGVLLVPFGGALLFAGVGMAAWATTAPGS